MHTDDLAHDPKLAALRLEDLRALLEAAIAQPGSVPTAALFKDVAELDRVLPPEVMQPIYVRLTELDRLQPRAPMPADVAIWADHLCYVSINMKPWEHMDPGASALYHAGLSLLESEPESLEIKMGHALMLDALAASPAALQGYGNDS